MIRRMILALVTATGLFAQDGANADSQLPRAAVLPLKGAWRGQLTDQTDTLYQMTTTLLLRLKRFDLIERAQLQSVLGEGKFQNSGLVDDSGAVELGKQLGAKVVFLGSWTGNVDVKHSESTDSKGVRHTSTSYPGQISVNLRMVEVQTGRIKATFQASGAPFGGTSVTDATRSMMADLEKKLDRAISNEFPLAGIVLKVLSDREMLIDLGKGDGIKKDDVFQAIQRGEDIIHPRTGARIPGEKTVLAEVEVVRVDERTSVVKVTKNQQKITFKVGMELEQKPKEASGWEKFGDWLRR